MDYEQLEGTSVERDYSRVRQLFIILAAAIYVLVSGCALYYAHRRIAAAEERMNTYVSELQQRVAVLETTGQTLVTKLGVTEKELERRSTELRRTQRAVESRLSAQQ